VYKDFTSIDPLIIFRCKNKQCRQIFPPAPILSEADKKLYFECPMCGSKYEAHYTNVGIYADQQSIMLQERPKMVYQGTKIASS